MEIPDNLSKSFLAELEKLKQEIREIKELQGLGASVADEVQREIGDKLGVAYLRDGYLSDRVKMKRGRGASPLLEFDILAAQKLSKSAVEAARRMGVCYVTYLKYARLYGIHTLKNKATKGIKKNVNPNLGKYPLREILEGKFPEYPVFRLKDKLVRSRQKDACCEMCGYRERRIVDGKIPLLLNFEDGDPKNHKLENIKLLCYNCTFVAGKGYIKRGVKHFDPDVMQGSDDLFVTRF
jgi:hypothetical protein